MRKTGCILVTGFEPFGGESINPTGMIVERLPEEIDGYKIIRLVLPVEFNRCVELASEAYDRYSPKAVIMLGQAGGRSAITVETVGKNIMNARIPDNAGYKPQSVLIEENGPQIRHSTLPVTQIVDAVKSEGIPAEKSDDAGEYVCNNLLYGMLGHIKGRVPAGFIHVPFVREQGQKPYLEFDDVYKSIFTAIKAVMKGLKQSVSNISCYVVTLMLVLLFLEVLREKYTLPDTGWLAPGAFLISMLFIPVMIIQTIVMFIQENFKSALLFIMEFVIWILTAYFYFFELR